MKIKKIITVMSCAALIAATALPLTACGGSKSFKTAKEARVKVADYVEEYRPNGAVNDIYDRDAVSIKKVPSSTYESKATASADNNIAYFSQGTGDNKSYSAYNTKSGETVHEGLYGFDSIAVNSLVTSDDTGTELFDCLVLIKSTGSGADAKILYTAYAEDGTDLFDGITQEELDGVTVTLSKHKIKTSKIKDKIFDVLTLTYKKDGSEVVKYFSMENLPSGTKNLNKHNKEDIVFVDPLVDKGSAAFSATMPMDLFIATLNAYESDGTLSVKKLSVKKIDGDLAAYSVGGVSNDLVFYKDGAETGRVNMDGVDENRVGFAGNYMYYVKKTQLSNTDKNANLIISGDSDLAYNYELHRYDIVKDKDKKLSFTDNVTDFKSLYNNMTKTYDALVVSGEKVINKVSQPYNEFTYITDSELKINYDVSSVYGFDMSDLSSINGGKFLMETDDDDNDDYVVLDEKLNVLSEFENSHYYNKSELFSFTEDGRTGFADVDGKVVIEPKYEKVGGSGYFTFFDGYTVADNVLTGERVFLKKDGTETVVPNLNLDEKHYDQGWYTIKTEGASPSYTICDFSGREFSVDNYKYKVNNYVGDTADNMLEFNVGNDGAKYVMYLIDPQVWTTTVTL